MSQNYSLQEEDDDDHVHDVHHRALFVSPVTIYSPVQHDEGTSRGSELDAVLGLTSTTLGAGILSLPRAFALLGVLYGTIAVLSVGFISSVTLKWLVECGRFSRRKNYESVAHHYFGAGGKILLHAFLLLLLFGASVAMMVVFVDSVSGLWLHISRLDLLIGFAGIALPVCMAEELKTLRWVSGASVVCLGYFYFLVLWKFCGNSFSEIDWNEKPKSASDASLGLSVIFSSFICHFNIFKIDYELGDPNTKRTFASIEWSSLVICNLVYWSIGLMGYVMFGPDVPGNLLSAFGSSELPVQIAKVTIGLTNFFKFPLIILPLRESLIEALPASAANRCSSLYARFLLTTVIIAVVSVVADVSNDLMTVIGLVGSTAGMATAFVLPALMKMKMDSDQRIVFRELEAARVLLQPLSQTGGSREVRVSGWWAPLAIAITSTVIGMYSTFCTITSRV